MQTTTSTPSTSPLDKNVQTFDQRLNVSNTLYIIGLILALLGSALIVWYSNKLGKAKDEQYQHEKRAAEENIAAANAVAETAKKDASVADAKAAQANLEAAKANEGLAKSNLEIARLTNEAAALRVEAENAKANIASAQADAAKANEGAIKATAEVARLQIVVANAETKRAEAERALLELQERIKDRHLTTEQRARLVELFKANPKGKINVSCVGGSSPEPCIFASEIVDTLKLGGWDVEFSPGFISVGGIPVGLIIQVRSSDKAPVRAEVLQKALGEIGFAAPGEVQPTLDEQTVNLIVGAKPPHQ